MSSKYVLTNDATGREIERGMPHWEVTIAAKNTNGYPVQEPAKHFLHHSEVFAFLETVSFVEAKIVWR